MADVMVYASSGTHISNGGVVTAVFNTGERQTKSPEVNQHWPSAQMVTLYDNRFDSLAYYGNA